MKDSMPCTGSVLSETHKCWENWYTAKEKIRQIFQGCLCPSCVRRVCFLHKSTEFCDMRTECQRKSILIHFLLYSFFSITPRSLAPKFVRSPITRSPIPCSPIARSATLTPRSLFPPNHLLPDRSLSPNHPVPSILLSNFLHDCFIALPLVFEK